MPKHASPERKAHAYLLLSAYTRAEMRYAEVARITGPRGDYPYADAEMSQQTLARIVERAARTDDPAFRKVRVTTGTLTVPSVSIYLVRLSVSHGRMCLAGQDSAPDADGPFQRPVGQRRLPPSAALRSPQRTSATVSGQSRHAHHGGAGEHHYGASDGLLPHVWVRAVEARTCRGGAQKEAPQARASFVFVIY